MILSYLADGNLYIEYCLIFMIKCVVVLWQLWYNDAILILLPCGDFGELSITMLLFYRGMDNADIWRFIYGYFCRLVLFF